MSRESIIDKHTISMPKKAHEIIEMAENSKKEEKKEEKPKLKSYSVKVEAIAPITINYRLYAYSPEEALEKVERSPLTNVTSTPKITYARLKRIKGEVFKFGTILKVFTKQY